MAPTVYGGDGTAFGGRGEGPTLELPRSIAIDYRVYGTCSFSVSLWISPVLEVPISAAKLTMTLTGPEVAGTWRLSIKPGAYMLVGGGSSGGDCVYVVTVRGDR